MKYAVTVEIRGGYGPGGPMLAMWRRILAMLWNGPRFSFSDPLSVSHMPWLSRTSRTPVLGLPVDNPNRSNFKTNYTLSIDLSFNRSWSQCKMENTNDNVISTIYALLAVCIDYIIIQSCVQSYSVTTHFKLECEDISPEAMEFILNRPVFSLCGPMVEFHSFCSRDACGRHSGDREFKIWPDSEIFSLWISQSECQWVGRPIQKWQPLWTFPWGKKKIILTLHMQGEFWTYEFVAFDNWQYDRPCIITRHAHWSENKPIEFVTCIFSVF